MEYIQADIWVRFQRMQGHRVHFVCADDAHGAPIMLRAESEGVTPQALVARIAATRPKTSRGFHLSFDHWHSTDSPENVELSQDIYRRLKAAGFVYDKEVEQFYDPGEGDVPARSLHQGHVPEMRHEGPVRRRLRELQLDLRADRSHRPVFDAVRRAPRAALVAASVLPAFRSEDRRVPAPLDARARAGPVAAAGGAEQDPRVAGRGGRPRQAHRLGHFARRALLRDSRFPTSRASTSTSGSTRRSAISRRSRATSTAARRRQTAMRGRSPTACRRPTPSSITSSARTSSTSTRCSGRRCSSSPASPTGRRPTCSCTDS